jgi:hypothetical protein
MNSPNDVIEQNPLSSFHSKRRYVSRFPRACSLRRNVLRACASAHAYVFLGQKQKQEKEPSTHCNVILHSTRCSPPRAGRARATSQFTVRLWSRAAATQSPDARPTFGACVLGLASDHPVTILLSLPVSVGSPAARYPFSPAATRRARAPCALSPLLPRQRGHRTRLIDRRYASVHSSPLPSSFHAARSSATARKTGGGGGERSLPAAATRYKAGKNAAVARARRHRRVSLRVGRVRLPF